jgi:hypothetical protein
MSIICMKFDPGAYVCMYACMYVCMYVRMYVCAHLVASRALVRHWLLPWRTVENLQELRPNWVLEWIELFSTTNTYFKISY